MNLVMIRIERNERFESILLFPFKADAGSLDIMDIFQHFLKNFGV